MEIKKIIFDKKYYSSLMKEFGYNPLEFEKINFSLGNLKKTTFKECGYVIMKGIVLLEI